MNTDPRTAAATYFDAWRANDFDRLRSVLADEIEFVGPLGQVKGGDECAEAMRRLSEIKTDLVVERVFVDGDDVLTWFELHTSLAPPAPVANWSHIEGGKVARVRVTFDPRGILGGA